MKKFLLLMLACVFSVSLALFAACQPENNHGEGEVVGIEITTPPQKLNYKPGETFDITGMVVSKLYDDGTKAPVYDYVIDKTEPLTVSDKVVTVTWEAFSAKVDITVASGSTTTSAVTGIQLRADDGFVYQRTASIDDGLFYREEYEDGGTGYWLGVSGENVKSYQISEGMFKVTVAVTISGKEFTAQLDIPVNDDYITVEQLLTKTVNAPDVYLLDGVFVGVTTVISRVEFIVLDTASGKFIGIAGMEGEGAIGDNNLDLNGFKVGDRIRVPVKLVQQAEAELNSNSLKVYADYAGGSFYKTGVVESGVDYSYDKSGATQISTQAELVDYLTVGNRQQHFYQFVKLHGEIGLVRYANSGSLFYRFFFDGVTSYAEQKIEGNCSPVFMSNAQLLTTGNTVGELFGKPADWAPTSWAAPERVLKDVYALFIGGNTYYHQFLILKAEDVSDIPNPVTDHTFTPPQTTKYPLNGQLSLEGAKLVLEYQYGPSAEVPITEEMLDSSTLPNMSQKGEYVVKGTYQGIEFQFTVTVTDKVVQSVSVNDFADKRFHKRADYNAVIEALTAATLTVTYTDNSTDTVNIERNMITCPEVYAEGEQQITVEYSGVKTTVTITVADLSITVKDLKTKEAGEEVYDVRGVVIGSVFISGTGASPANPELLIKDKTTGDVIGVRGLDITYENKLLGLELGDEIMVKVTVQVTCTAQNNSEYGKLAAFYKEDELLVLSKNNSVAVPTENAVDIYNQQTLNQFLQNADVRKANAYKLIKLAAGAKIVNYNATTISSYITYDGTDSASTKINNLSPYLHEMNETMLLNGKTYLELLFGPDAVKTNFSAEKINTLDKDVYLMYIGGQGAYYHQFVLLGESYVTETAEKHLKEVTFTEPENNFFMANDQLDLTGGKISYIYWYSGHNQIIELTDQSVVMSGEYDMTQPGNYTLTFTHGENHFEWQITVSAAEVSSIEIEGEITVYNRNGYAEMPLEGVQVKINYVGGSSAKTALTREMLPTEDVEHGLGDVKYTVTFMEQTAQLTVHYKAYTVSQFNALDQTYTGSYDVTGIVVGPVSSQQFTELLLKDKDSYVFMTIINSQLAGTTSALKLDTEVLAQGDEIVVLVKRVHANVENAEAPNYYKTVGDATNKQSFVDSLVKLSTGNAVDLNVETIKQKANVTEITTQEQLVEFLRKKDNYNTIVKFPATIKFVAYQTTGLRLYLDNSIDSLAKQKVDNISPFMALAANKYWVTDFTSKFSNTTSTNYSEPITTEYEIYALFTGGNGYYSTFIALDDSWFVKPAAPSAQTNAAPIDLFCEEKYL